MFVWYFFLYVNDLNRANKEPFFLFWTIHFFWFYYQSIQKKQAMCFDCWFNIKKNSILVFFFNMKEMWNKFQPIPFFYSVLLLNAYIKRMFFCCCINNIFCMYLLISTIVYSFSTNIESVLYVDWLIDWLIYIHLYPNSIWTNSKLTENHGTLSIYSQKNNL